MKHIALPLYLVLVWSLAFSQSTHLPSSIKVQVQYTPGHPANSFIPTEAMGAAFDGHGQGDIDRILRPANIKAMKAVGLKPLSYRLRTELGIEAWHWNPRGRWSDPSNKQGYWTSDARPSGRIHTSYGYFLPRRGNTHDNANDDAYSRIDDGDTTTFWKSNPYLDAYFTKESNEHHPQWMIIDFGKAVEVNAIRILWADPYALDYTVDVAGDIQGYFDPYQPGIWHRPDHSLVSNTQDRDRLVIFSSVPVKARFIRISMWQSSKNVRAPRKDIRDGLGFAMKEVYAGLMDRSGQFHDIIIHTPSNKTQTIIRVSSTDPWHRAIDIDSATEQAGIDRFFTCGLTQGRRPMMPAALVFDTPANMVALLKYMQASHYQIDEMELGEEPEGQLMAPEDYAALYCQWSAVLKKQAPAIQLGGPSFAWISSTGNDDNAFTEQAWTRRFLHYLKHHGHLQDFNFFSTEWYPAEDICAATPPQLTSQPERMRTALLSFQHVILPPHTPIYITEYGYSAFSGVAEVRMEGALMYADILGQFLTLGGTKAFLYGYEPAYLEQRNDCDWGNNMLFALDDDNGTISYRTAAYFGVRMLTHQWAIPSNERLNVYPVNCYTEKHEKTDLVTAYALQRPNKKWAILFINKDPDHSWPVNLSIFNTTHHSDALIQAPGVITQYSGKQYHWTSNGPKGYPDKALPPRSWTTTDVSKVEVPPYSLTILEEE